MSKVLVVATSPKTHGGIATVVKAHMQGSQWKDYHCRWIAVHRDGSSWRKILYFIMGLAKYICCLPFYDIIHIHMSTKASAIRKIYFVKLAQLFRKKIIVHLHCGTQVENSWSDKMTYIFSTVNVGIMLADRIKYIVSKHTGREDNLVTCYNPCPIVNTAEKMARKNHILYVGTIGENKGYHILIQAFAKIAKKHPDWKVLFAGIGEMDKAYTLINKFNLSNQIEMLGWVDGRRKERLYREASILCLPSFMEGFPMTVLEAWAYGVPVISTPVGGIPDVAIDGKNMCLFEPGDIDTLTKKLAQLIENPDLRKTLGLESKKFANGIFNQQTINKQIGEIYKSLSKMQL